MSLTAPGIKGVVTDFADATPSATVAFQAVSASGLVDMKEAGMGEREIQMLYILNKRVEITIQTPVGETKEIEVKELVKQGTVFGPLMCCVNSAQIIKMREKTVTHITPELSIETVVYVDDILAAGSKDVIEKVGQNLGRMEIEKNTPLILEIGKATI